MSLRNPLQSVSARTENVIVNEHSCESSLSFPIVHFPQIDETNNCSGGGSEIRKMKNANIFAHFHHTNVCMG